MFEIKRAIKFMCLLSYFLVVNLFMTMALLIGLYNALKINSKWAKQFNITYLVLRGCYTIKHMKSIEIRIN
jgi:hypothetical protein